MTHSVQFVNLERYLRKHMQDDSISVHNTVGPPCITIIFSLVAGPWPPTCAPSTSAPTTPSSTGTWHASTTSRGKSVRKWRRTGQVSGNHICIQGDSGGRVPRLGWLLFWPFHCRDVSAWQRGAWQDCMDSCARWCNIQINVYQTHLKKPPESPCTWWFDTIFCWPIIRKFCHAISAQCSPAQAEWGRQRNKPNESKSTKLSVEPPWSPCTQQFHNCHKNRTAYALELNI